MASVSSEASTAPVREPRLGESRWPPAIALIAFLALNIALRVWLPNEGAIRVVWLLPAVEMLLLVVLVAGDPRAVLGVAASAIYGDPTARLTMIGITGTAGKTSTAYLVESGLRAAGLEPQRVAIGGGSDANVFRRDGFDCVLLSNGTDAVHTANEMVPARSLEKMLEVCEGILAAVAAA